MRYRHFGDSGKAVSAVSLLLTETPGVYSAAQWRGMIFSAMENGVNCFDAPAGCEAIEEGLGAALQAVERRLLFVILRVRGDHQAPMNAARLSELLRGALSRTGAAYFDVLMLDSAAIASLTQDGRELLAEVRAAAIALKIGVSGDDDIAASCIGAEPFDVLATPFNLTSGWTERRRLREAAEANMVIIAYDPAPLEMLQANGAGVGKATRKNPLNGSGTYAFLHDTRGWTAEELCLAYVLTEPSLATVQCQIAHAEMIETLANVAERDPPTGLSAQIEMARFSKEREQQKKRA
ncbi:MAG: aldo/keto reductase [Phenylobacterium sp.]|uniref:aldo/keto reductase n=1 Tax=Phenylobacterium sp. TaxID=1871053 RepID=UPI0027334879|nr:aldo/keto reductase [Phenylobacterium sp.]MDP3174728.1 aldo/keto reductase [Phenylobacterium sp.]